MSIFSKKAFTELAKMNEEEASTFYIPTFRSGDNEKGKITFKNQIQQAKKKLKELGKGENYIKGYVKPLDKLLNEPIFWRHISDGLAIYHSMKTHRVYTVPVHFKESYYLGRQYYLTPIIPFFNGNGRFYILALSLNTNMLFEGSRDEIGRISIDEHIPASLEDVVGHDYKQKSLQVRTDQTGSNDAHFHGHGSGKDDKSKEVEQYLRAVDKGFTEIAGKDGKPLIIASVDNLFAAYKKINSYKNLQEQNISGNPEHADTILLHEKAWDLLKHKFSELNQRAKEYHRKNNSNGSTTSDIRKIVSKSLEGNIDTLFVEQDTHIWGSYDPQELTVNVDDNDKPDNECLIDKVTKATFLQGGHVFIEKKENMPDSSSPVNALLRVDN